MSDLASASTNSLSIQQLFSSLTNAGSAGSSNTDPDLFGQNLPSDPAESATSGSAKSGGTSTSTSAAAASLADQARSKRDAALAQSRLDLLGLQEQSNSGKGTHGAHHHHGGAKPTSASADKPTDTPTAAASSAASTGGAGQTGITGAAANDEQASGLSTLLLAQMAAA